MRRGSQELEADALAFAGIITEINDTAFLLLLREGIGDELHGAHIESLGGIEKTAVSIDDDGFAGLAETAAALIFPGEYDTHSHEDA